MARTSYNKAIENSDASNCKTSYVFVDFIYNHTHELNNELSRALVCRLVD